MYISYLIYIKQILKDYDMEPEQAEVFAKELVSTNNGSDS